jgi:glycosyltransferase involved in cell wall biosynthesis
MRAGDLSSLNVCFLAGTLAKGGAERQLYYMLRALQQSGARSRVLCFAKGEYWEAEILKLGVPVIHVGASKLGRLRQILHELRKERPDILQSAHFYTNAYAQVAARILGIQEIGAIRCDLISEVSGKHPWLRRISLSSLRVAAANSRAAIKSAEEYGMDSQCLRFLPNVVDTDYFRPSPWGERSGICVLGAGRLAEQKRFDRFLRVVARARERVSEKVRVCIAGDGPLRAWLEATAAEVGFKPGEVQFTGQVDDMLAWYRAADVFLLTSGYEGTPNVVLEAMASGLPVVATRVGDVPEVITDGVTGYLAQADDEDGLADRLELLLRFPELRERMSRVSRAHIAANHAAQNLAGYLRSLYGGLLFHEPVSMAHR